MKMGEDFTIEPFKPREKRSRGRPRKEGGPYDKKIDLRVNKFIDEALNKVEDKSEFIRKTLEPELRQLDPGPACGKVQKIIDILQKGIMEATARHNYDEAKALSNVANQLKPFIQLCEISSDTNRSPIEIEQFTDVLKTNPELKERLNGMLSTLEFIGARGVDRN